MASLLEETTNQVRRGQMDLRAATTICYIANSLVHALEVNARAQRDAAQAEHRPARKKHPAPLQIILRDHTGRIIDQLPPDPGFAPPSGPSQRVSAERAPNQREQSARAGSPSSPVLALWGETAQQRSVAEPLDKTPTENREPRTVSLGTASSNTPSPQTEQGMAELPKNLTTKDTKDQNDAQKSPTTKDTKSGTGERKVSAGSRELFARAQQRSVAEPLDKTTTASSNTPSPSPSADQGMRTARVSAERAPDQRKQSARAQQRSVAEPLYKTQSAEPAPDEREQSARAQRFTAEPLDKTQNPERAREERERSERAKKPYFGATTLR